VSRSEGKNTASRFTKLLSGSQKKSPGAHRRAEGQS
jgi:hypothetical protein